MPRAEVTVSALSSEWPFPMCLSCVLPDRCTRDNGLCCYACWCALCAHAEVAEQNGIRGLLQKQWCLQCTSSSVPIFWLVFSPCCSCVWAPCIMTAYGPGSAAPSAARPARRRAADHRSTYLPLPQPQMRRSSSRIKRGTPPTRCLFHEVHAGAPPPVSCLRKSKVHGAFREMTVKVTGAPDTPVDFHAGHCTQARRVLLAPGRRRGEDKYQRVSGR